MGLIMAVIFDLFSDEDTLSVFETLTIRKRADLRAIRESLKMPEDKAIGALTRLANAGLVEQVAGPVQDFNTYFLSAKGLAASRQLKAGQRLSRAL
jgi:DNA-binding IclR family transcriptional regulator